MLLITLIGAALGCASNNGRATGPPNVVLIVMDTTPGELDNVVDREPDLVGKLEKMLLGFQEKRGHEQEIVEAPRLTPKEINRPKALGYIHN